MSVENSFSRSLRLSSLWVNPWRKSSCSKNSPSNFKLWKLHLMDSRFVWSFRKSKVTQDIRSMEKFPGVNFISSPQPHPRIGRVGGGLKVAWEKFHRPVSPLQFFPAIRAVSTFGFLQKINRLDDDLLFPHGQLFCFQIVFIMLDQFGFCHFKSLHCCAIASAIPGKVFDRIFARSFVNNPLCFSPCFFE